MIVRAHESEDTGDTLHRLNGQVTGNTEDGWRVEWTPLASATTPALSVDEEGVPDVGVYGDYVGASLTAHAFDRVTPGLGMWLVTLAAWLFAISTMISWSYYGERCWTYLFGQRASMLYKMLFLVFVFLGSIITATNNLEFSDLMILSMAFPAAPQRAHLSFRARSSRDPRPVSWSPNAARSPAAR